MNLSYFDKLFNNVKEREIVKRIQCKYCNSTDYFKHANVIVCSNCNVVIKEDFVDAEIEDHSSYVSELTIETNTKLKITGRGRKGIKRLNNSTVNVYKEKIIAEAKKRFEDVVERYEMWKFAINRGILKEEDYSVLPSKDMLKQATKYEVNMKQFEDLINSATIIFKVIKPYIISREPKKTAIIAYCFYYASKEQYIIFTNTELQFLFGVNAKTLTAANNRINRTLKEHADLRQSLNRRPINMHNAITIVKRRLKLTDEQLAIIEIIINRMENIGYIMKNDAQIIVAGILNVCCKKISAFHNLNIDEEDILNILDISITSLRKATKQIMPFIYQSSTSLY